MGRGIFSASPAASKPPTPEPQPEKIDLDDGHAIKHKLDAAASQVLPMLATKNTLSLIASAGERWIRAAGVQQQQHAVLQLLLSTIGAQCPVQYSGPSSAALSACCHLLQVILQSGYEEDHLISNVKIALGLIA